MKNLKEKAISYWESKLYKLDNPDPNVIDMTRSEVKDRLRREYQQNLKIVKSKEEEWFKSLHQIANARITAALCGGHYKAQMNYEAVYRLSKEVEVEIPSDEILYSFGSFNGVGSV